MKNQKGFSLVELLVVVIIIGIIAAIAIPSLLASRRSANEGSAIASLRTIHSAQASYFATKGNNTAYGVFSDLTGQQLLDSTFNASPMTKSGYTFTATITASGSPGYCVKADPTTASGTTATGTRFFGVDESGVIKTHTATIGCAAGVLASVGTALGTGS